VSAPLTLQDIAATQIRQAPLHLQIDLQLLLGSTVDRFFHQLRAAGHYFDASVIGGVSEATSYDIEYSTTGLQGGFLALATHTSQNPFPHSGLSKKSSL